MKQSAQYRKSGHKDKNATAILAFFLGWLGIHRFYLGQIGRGFLYLLLSITMISFVISLYDFIYFLVMSNEKFDLKYNNLNIEDYTRVKTKGSKRRKSKKRVQKYKNPYGEFMKKGKTAFENYEIEEAIVHFRNALEVKPKDIAIHFNLACCNSILENAELTYHNLQKAVRYGFNDYSRILEHEALAFIRLDDEWEDFVANGFRQDTKQSDEKSFNFIQELKKITELRDRGIIDNSEFEKSKIKLLGS